ncbi:aspartyl-phosphate phosphatase Spo0E family protein [Bacillus carboniphilus]|uniref:Aspartyl-phosphate phosphatase Spo0E family protein n=1 Tax=Bacillus carboniphilus TaxID=86663 RepID=A0ABY9JWG0_9BACI|nr:aspartyl-phosphate phosphatase Spo0E family protein [Bacillus carboniphilus]WLR43139.1 aspartyl-phosphate phosphatase Spo0E family protein [Bacillus carboniphilus]
MDHNDNVQLEILMKREELFKIAERKGLTNEKTVKCSQELDEILNKCQFQNFTQFSML